MSRLFVVFLVLAALMLPVSAQAADPSVFKVVFLMAETPQDHGWNAAHWRGIQQLKTLGTTEAETSTGFSVRLPDGRLLEVTTIQGIGYAEPDIKRMAEDAVNKGADLVFGTWFNAARPMAELAEIYPNVLFEHCSGYPMVQSNGRNFSTYFIKMEQGDYAAGVAAARMGFTSAGLVATFPIPEPVRGINGFILGLQTGDPFATVRVVWILSWLDQQREYDAAKALSAEGFPLIRAMADTPYSEQATCDDGKTAVGYGSDAEPYAPCTIITNEWNWAAYYVPTVKSALDGTWKSQDWWGGFPEGAITMAGKAVPYIQDTITKLKAGFNPFCWISGQIKVNGEMKDITIPRCLDAMELLTMQWYVIGQQGEYPDNAAMPQ